MNYHRIYVVRSVKEKTISIRAVSSNGGKLPKLLLGTNRDRPNFVHFPVILKKEEMGVEVKKVTRYCIRPAASTKTPPSLLSR